MQLRPGTLFNEIKRNLIQNKLNYMLNNVTLIHTCGNKGMPLRRNNEGMME
jgi:hypothetical protein